MLLGFPVVRTLRGLVRTAGAMSPVRGRTPARALAAAGRPFHRVNCRFPRAGAAVVHGARPARWTGRALGPSAP